MSKQLAVSLLKKEHPTSLKNSNVFNDDDKEYILKNLTDKSLIKERKDQGMQINIQEDLRKVSNHIDVPVRKLYQKYVWAASIAVLIAIGYLFRGILFVDKPLEEGNTTIVENSIKKGTDKAVLTLEDGTSVVLGEGESLQKNNLSSNGQELVYNASKTQENKINYNYLTIPRGGQFSLKLADGTQVWLNSETQLKYPVVFVDGLDREVELVYGEAYFDVSPSTNHNGTKFRVLNKDQEVEVLGTEFNIKAYEDESSTYTTLVEGKVTVFSKEHGQDLTPNQQAVLNKTANTFQVNRVDVYNEISWKEGVFSFEDKPLSEIMRVLSRWYDMDVVFEKEEIGNVAFNGILGKEQDINEILITIQNFKIIEAYEINGKTVFLK
ncbi:MULTISPECIES: FecR family protein [Flavobacteriaceae]|uniref:FecR family protein n=1 Tax=Flavobacteriaceae TaxID=49546 RepID=UPI001493159D|nr:MULTISPECIES: FecR family protein [Allomuricauda]MDC6367647.1 FecR domain-containing protein [Muricauda sp. AC10]